ncbi:MAG: hypothetical protein IID61_04345 [SAR324 cluster bacterium]|nr:hypothetical protein [SAR324 cluster bacterium]
MSRALPPAPRREPKAIGFVGWGAGNDAVFRVLTELGAQACAEARVYSTDYDIAPPQKLHRLPTLEALFGECDLIFVDTPPDELEQLLPSMRLAISDRNVIAVVGPSLPMQAVKSHLQERKLIRCLITAVPGGGRATLAYYATPFVSSEELAAFRGLFVHLEHVLELQREEQFEVVRGLAGIAPAVLYTVADAMADGALMMGLPRADALPFLAAILLSAARTMREGGEHPAVLREKELEAEVAAAGLMELESAGMRGLLMRVVKMAIRRIAPAPSSE